MTSRFLPAILLATALLYSPSFSYRFVYDDTTQILENQRLQSWSHLPELFREQVWSHQQGGDQGNYYRPLFLLWLLLNFQLFGSNPVGWHVATVAIHLLAVALVYHVAGRLLRDERAGATAALVFALHPAQIESVAWISGVPEPLATVFLFLAFAAHLRREEVEVSLQTRWNISSSITYFAAMLCKETAAVFPAGLFVLVLCRGAEEGEGRRRHALRALREALRFLPALLLYLVLRVTALAGWAHVNTYADFSTLLLTAPLLIWTYLKILLLPFRLAVFYPLHFVPTPGRDFWMPLLAGLLVAVLVGRWARQDRLVRFAALWVCLFLTVPVGTARFFHEGTGLAHDRYLYLPIFGFALLVGCGWCFLGTKDRTAKLKPLVLTVVLLLYGAGILTQQRHWQTTLTLFQRSLDLYPDAPQPVRVLLASELMEEGRSAAAGNLYREAFARKQDWFSIYGMGKWELQQGNYEQAEAYLLRAVALYPRNPRQYFHLGMTYAGAGRPREALPWLGKSVLLASRNLEYRLQFAHALESAGWHQPAIQQYKIVLEQRPEEDQLRRYIAVLEARDIKGRSP